MSNSAGKYEILSEDPSCNARCHCCHYKHYNYQTQIERKQSWALKQLGAWAPVLKDIVPASPSIRLGYRSKTWMRSSIIENQLSLGMFRSIRGQGEEQGKWVKEFISWNSCPLLTLPTQEMLTQLRQQLLAEIPQFCENSLQGVWVGSPHLVIVSKNQDDELLKAVPWNKILVPPFDRVWFHRAPQVGKRIFSHGTIKLIYGPSQDQLQEESSVHPIKAFRQVAQALLQQARLKAVDFLLQSDPALVLDLYCGTGELAQMVPLSLGWIGIERSKEAVEYAQRLRPHSALHLAFAGTVEQRLKDAKVLAHISKPYALYINPPRPGLGEAGRALVLSLIQQKEPTAIAYLSCSASSLARDLREFVKAGYFVELLQPYDFFPQTEHFETLALLKKNSVQPTEEGHNGNKSNL